MNTTLSRISYTDALPELGPGGWRGTRPGTHPHLPPCDRPAPAPPSRLQQVLRSLQTVSRYQISPVFSVYSEQLLYLVRGHLLGPARLPQPDCLVPDMYAMFDIVRNRLLTSCLYLQLDCSAQQCNVKFVIEDFCGLNSEICMYLSILSIVKHRQHVCLVLVRGEVGKGGAEAEHGGGGVAEAEDGLCFEQAQAQTAAS